MSTPQEQYLDAMSAAADSWAKAAQQFFNTTPQASFPVASVDPSEVIDQVFDFAEQFLAAQRQFAKSLATASGTVADTMRSQAESFQTTLTEAAEQNIAATQKFVDSNSEIAQSASKSAAAEAEKVVEAAQANVNAATDKVVAAGEKNAAATTSAAKKTTAAATAPAKKAAASPRKRAAKKA